MDFIRANVLRRGGDGSEGQQSPDVEQQRAPDMEEQRRTTSSRFPTLPRLFTGHGVGNQRAVDGGRDDDSPKTPRFNQGTPSLTRSRAPDSGPPASDQGDRLSETDSRPSSGRTRTQPTPTIVEPTPTRGSEETGHERTRFRGTDPAEEELAQLADRGRRRRHRRHGSDGPRGRRRRGSDGPPRRFMFCFPWIKSRRIRSQILRIIISGIFLILMLAVYLSLSITKNINSSEFTILLILIILFITIFFCHGLVRLCLLIIKPRDEREEEERPPPLPQMFEPGGYAVPRQPIRVLLARDEEAAGVESDTSKLQPPAYGWWRESVRVDPNRIYWQRNENGSPIEPEEEEEEEQAGDETRSPARSTRQRPPSYASEDGVDYVVEARPRSTVPSTDVPLPPHPSEIGPSTPVARGS